jgi:hypothetical protein
MILKKMFAWYFSIVDTMQHMGQDKGRFRAHILAWLFLTAPLSIGLLIKHQIYQSAHPEILLRGVAVGAATEYPKLESVMPAWIECFDNTVLNKDYGHCDYEIRSLVSQHHLEQSFSKYQRYRDSMYSAKTAFFNEVWGRPEKDE